ncbi:hypothetical protein E4U42_004201 [Claviceps africana]|uniref:RecA family profile 1 domain-containing protein n=1 Tax=Claviceps africana TaxID=83212 RepID=A0A8K0J5D3_9HYPO|nr:hypothetical protein E4U42_004201 [Claviceps africana]
MGAPSCKVQQLDSFIRHLTTRLSSPLLSLLHNTAHTEPPPISEQPWHNARPRRPTPIVRNAPALPAASLLARRQPHHHFHHHHHHRHPHHSHTRFSPMTDLLTILPTFPQAAFSALLPVIEQHGLSTTDLLALHPADIAKQTRLPLLDLKRFIAAVQVSLSDDLVPRHPLRRFSHGGVKQGEQPEQPEQGTEAVADGPENAAQQRGGGGEQEEKEKEKEKDKEAHPASSSSTPSPLPPPTPPCRISTLDPLLDASLGGGIPTSSITEITGESGAGKTQFLLTLCLAVQLPPPHGLSKQALYVSTESGLATRRLSQMLTSHPLLQDVGASLRPSLDNILSTVTPDLESQDHILEYQVPVLLARHNIGLVVIDSVAANYRAEFERAATFTSSSSSSSTASYGANMAARSAALVRLGALLRNLARRHDVAVVVANQVADRFTSSAIRPRPAATAPGRPDTSQDSPLASRTTAKPPLPPSAFQGTPPLPSSSPPASSSPPPQPPFFHPRDDEPAAHPALRLDHQQRWFTGWGDDPRSNRALKTPSLGLVWSTQISCRIALLKRPVYGRPRQLIAPIEADDGLEVGATLKNWRRWIKVVFASHAAPSGQDPAQAIEFEVFAGGLRGVRARK